MYLKINIPDIRLILLDRLTFCKLFILVSFVPLSVEPGHDFVIFDRPILPSLPLLCNTAKHDISSIMKCNNYERFLKQNVDDVRHLLTNCMMG